MLRCLAARVQGHADGGILVTAECGATRMTTMLGSGWLRRRNGRLGRVCKWAGLCGCSVAAAGWIMSLFVAVGLGLAGNQLLTPKGGIAFLARPHWSGSLWQGEANWSIERQRFPHGWIPIYHPASRAAGASLSFTFIPYWLSLIVLAVPTAILFYRDRRYPPGHCQRCGYDLTGNVSGACPECGRATDRVVAGGD